MKSNSVLQNKRAFTLTPRATWFLQEFLRPQTAMPPNECKFCNSIYTVQRKDLFECASCGSYLGKAQS